MSMKTKLTHITCLLSALLALATGAAAQTTAFTYQGRLMENGAPANGSNDLAFTLYTALTGGAAVGAANVVNDVPVTNGLFTVPLDFPGGFDGSPRWLQILARPGGSVGAYTALVPRQPITSTPYAIRALSAGTAASATTANGVAAGSVTGAGLAPGAVNGAAIADGYITTADLSGPLLNSTFWKLGGNDVGTTTGANVIGTTNNQAMEVRVFGARALRIEPHGSAAPSLVGGYLQNNAGGAIGGAVAGGGTSGSPNALLGDYAFVGAGHGGRAATFGAVVGGAYNNALGQFAFVGTGLSNTNLGLYAAIVSGSNNFVGAGAYNAFIGAGLNNQVSGAVGTIGGGGMNRIGPGSDKGTIGGGYSNSIKTTSENATVSGGELNVVGPTSPWATISGGSQNQIWHLGYSSTIGGGVQNQIGTNSGNATIGGGYTNVIGSDATSATMGGGAFNVILSGGAGGTIGGGGYNHVGGYGGTVPGGVANAVLGAYGFAAGYRAKANHAGSFVWADSQDADFTSTADNQFSVRAAGGVQLAGDTRAYFGEQTRQMLNLWGTRYGIGVQSYNLYFRTDNADGAGGFAWYRGGVHSNVAQDPGADGQRLMSLTAAGLLVNGTGNGINGRTTSGADSAMFGQNFGGGIGVAGSTSGGGSAIYGDNLNPSGWAGNFHGNVYVENDQQFGAQTRQKLNLYGTAYGIGIQSGTMYFRTDDSAGAQTFAWYRGGKHHDGHFQPGAGGTDMMLLNTAGLEVRGNVCATLFLPCSDRNMKENFSPIDSREVLAKVVSLPISRWNFKEAKSTPHIGPMAQDFYAAFAVGPDNRHIGTVDADGVALAAIQGLNEIVREKDSKIHELEQRMERLEQMMLNSGKH